MATIRYGDKSTYPPGGVFGFGPQGDLVTFDRGVSAADLRLEQSQDIFSATLSGAGSLLGMLDLRSTFIGTFPAIYSIAASQFSFADDSQIQFANRYNGYTLNLRGGDADDLLVGSPNWGTTPLTLASTNGNAQPGDGPSRNGSLTPEGTMLVYTSKAGNLHGGSGAEATSQVYLRDGASGNSGLLSTTFGQLPTGSSWDPTIDATGRFIVWTTNADELGTGKGISKIVFVDMKSAIPTMLSIGLGGAAPNGNSDGAEISTFGNATVYRSDASNLVAGDTNGKSDVFVIHGGSTERVSVSSDEQQANNSSSEASISGDGRYVVFRSEASNLVANDTNGAVADIFLRDLDQGTTTLISRNADFGSYNPQISDNGKYVVFYSYDGLGLLDDNGGKRLNLFVASTANPKKLELASADADGNARDIAIAADDDGISGMKPAISGDGRYVVFASTTKLLVPDDTDNVQDLFVKDLVSGEIARIDTDDRGPSASPSISDDGRVISFSHAATNGATWQTYVVDNPLLHAILAGGDGDDSYQIARAADQIVESDDGGDDRVVASVSYRLPANVEDLVLAGAARNGTGNGLDNTLTGNDANNRLDGRGGADLMAGGDGNDSYVVDDSGDRVRETRGNGIDTVTASASHTLANNVENLRLSGGADLRASGNALANAISGNRGDNTIDGKGGDDTLTGNAGRDVFVLRNESGSDTITDFESGEDHVRIGAQTLAIGDGDGRLEGAVARNAPGRYASSAELVLFSDDIDGDIDAASAAAAIGSARDAYDAGDRRVFVVDNGEDTAVYLFESAGDDRTVSAGELHLLATLQGSETGLGDYLFA